MKDRILDRIASIGVMPVISEIETEDSSLLAGALIKGGVPAAEITYRMKNAGEVISRLRAEFPEMIIGAGTVTSVVLAEDAIQSGAQFIVTPGTNSKVIQHCLSKGVVVIPGIVTPSELEMVRNLGVTTMKFFPAEPYGGLTTIKALCGPYKDVRFMPTGGINLDNLPKYMSFDKIMSCGGTFMIGDNIKTRDWAQITQLCKKTVHAMLGLEIAHIGLNSEGEDEARSVADEFAYLLNGSLREGNSSIFIDDMIEVNKSVGFGQNGHIGLRTTSIYRAVRYFTEIGATMREDSAKYDTAGKLKAIYFRDEIGGFAIHLVQS